MTTSRTQASVSWLRRFARTTPGAVSVIVIVVVAGALIAAAISAAQLNGRIAERNAILERSEPLAYAAHNLYAALSAADAAAVSAFLSNEIGTGPMRKRYQQALADASSALADATAGATDVQARTAMAEISAQLSAYTGLVEAARANDRQGFPVGSGYLREASAMMQTELLPAAERIYSRDAATVDGDQRAVGSLPVLGLVLMALGLIAIVVGSVVVYRRTNRMFNIGLVVAAVAVLVAAGWLVIATQLAAVDIGQSRSAGTERFAALAKARILALQTRTVETLQLVARGDIGTSNATFDKNVADLNGLLDNGPAAAVDGVSKWTASHRKHTDRYSSGDYAGAVVQAIGGAPDASAAQFEIVDNSLRTELAATRATLRGEVASAGHRLAWSPTAVLVLLVIAAAAAVAGLWPRLKEFL
ncbi:hypothetical protein [Mycolicibacterium fluoranthenivorans]|jgi:hypothetical protein|uniref:Uncharacterized protein n=1 Tax=Mycolicibacterium fluoranthenivorans TaxID=258505 RepID=A0A1G4WBG9_9MYCO|nr:hypothetical protein [Mycolicibacterium fluoranthenivorans]SCX19922.1 hypothetical protein SAMN02799620_02782 [Mycolicibacterium fluoranthenivorans]